VLSQLYKIYDDNTVLHIYIYINSTRPVVLILHTLFQHQCKTYPQTHRDIEENSIYFVQMSGLIFSPDD